MILVYTKEITNRIRYTFELVLGQLLGLEYELTSETEAFHISTGPKFSYTDKPLDEELFIYATPLLFQKGTRQTDVATVEWEGTKGLFPAPDHAHMPFDIFAASFYMVSRYEEYLPFIKDFYGRFPAQESLAYKEGFLEKPVVELWAQGLGKILKERLGVEPAQRTYSFTPTIDVDSAFSYLNKGLIRTVGGYIMALQRFDIDEILERTKILMGSKKDPFDTFDLQFELHRKHGLKPIYFMLVGGYDEYDKNVSLKTLKFQELIKSVADSAEVGIHPSYASNINFSKLRKETDQLAAVLKRDISQSRQHFLKLEMPTTYQNLLEIEIEHDYTMGFASQPGFRAGTSTPFKFYNLDTEEISALTIHPFTVMDATLQYYLKLDAESAIQRIRESNDAVRSVNGTFVSLWHNNSLCEEREWKGWRRVYEELLEIAAA
jgi:hypothetical protein